MILCLGIVLGFSLAAGIFFVYAGSYAEVKVSFQLTDSQLKAIKGADGRAVGIDLTADQVDTVLKNLAVPMIQFNKFSLSTKHIWPGDMATFIISKALVSMNPQPSPAPEPAAF